MAAPFVQGQLRKEHVSIDMETKCRHCDLAMHFAIDSQMRVSIRESGAHPLVFMPDIDRNTFSERTIIHSY